MKAHIDSVVSGAAEKSKAELAGFKALSEKVETQDTQLKANADEKKALDDAKKKLEDEVTKLKTEIHKNRVEKVYDLQKGIKKKVVMDLKNDEETEAYKAELAKRSDDSLNDTISDLNKEITRVVDG